MSAARSITLDDIDRRIIAATSVGLPLVAEPYLAVASELGIPVKDLLQRMARMLEAGAIRRIGAVPNHFRLGLTANGMSVWDVDDTMIDELGPKVGGLTFVTHCYRRPRHLPDWPYNLFAMVHGLDRDVVAARIDEIAELLGPACRSHDVLYSKRILKKTGLRLAG